MRSSEDKSDVPLNNHRGGVDVVGVDKSSASAISGAASAVASIAASGVSTISSAADRRRQAALEMYHSTQMVEDNFVDDRVQQQQLGTIDSISPSNAGKMSSPRSPGANPTRDAVAAAMERSLSNTIPMKERVTSFGSNASRAKTDVTTSTVMTAQIGNRESPKKSPTFGRSPTAGRSPTMARGGGGNDFSFGESNVVDSASAAAAVSALLARTSPPGSSMAKCGNEASPSNNNNSIPPSPPVRLESPAAQRRRERAKQRGFAKGTPISPTGVDGRKVLSPVNKSMPPMPPSSSSSIQRTKTDDESVAQSSVALSTSASQSIAAASTVSSVAAGSGISDSAPSRSKSFKKFGKKSSSKNKGSGASETGSSPGQGKKKSIFGVAKLIRKVVRLFPFRFIIIVGITLPQSASWAHTTYYCFHILPTVEEESKIIQGSAA